MKAYLIVWLWLLSPIAALNIPKVSLTITAEKRLLEVVWHNIDWTIGDKIIITRQPPISYALIGQNWNPEIFAEVAPRSVNGWVTTNVTFDYEISGNVSITTGCYGYWINYFTWTGELMATGCLKAFATWMNDLRPGIENLRFSDLFIAGTHDAGSYRVGFEPGKWETPITKYSLTQDEDIRGQLVHGARYLDIRPAYYKAFGEPFYVNHGVTRQRPMSEVVEHVRQFVRETKEFVIFGMKEFPFGFTDLSVHEKFVAYLKEEFAELIVDAELTWDVTLGDLWKRGQYIILAYDERPRWGNVQSWETLEIYLRSIYVTQEEKSSRPMSDMAELTADSAGVALDLYGGLRRMADNVNSGVSNLYRFDLGTMANIVAVDYIRGTTVAELAIEINKSRIEGLRVE